MPVEISIAQVMSLGVLCATVAFLFLVLVIGLYVTRKVVRLAGRFQSVGAERINGRIQMRGLFTEQSTTRGEVAAGSKLGNIKKLFDQATDFEPTAEDLQRVARVEQTTGDPGGAAN